MDFNDDELYQEKKEDEKDNLIVKILNNSKENKNDSIKCKVVEEKEKDDFIFMKINLFNMDYTQFIRKNDKINLKNNDIKFEIKDLNLININDNLYFCVEHFKILEHKIYEFKKTFSYKSINEIDNDSLFSIILKAKEIFVNCKDTNFIFQDLYGNSINLEYKGNYLFENGKIYRFNGFIYDKSQQLLKSTIISSIQKYSNDKNKLDSVKDILKYEKGKLVNFKSKIKSFSLISKSIKIEDSDGKIYTIKVNYNLLKKISLNGVCYFFNFSKKNNDEFEMTNFSDIEFEEETFIEFIFENFDSNKNFYNVISINKKHYNIDKSIVDIKIKDKNKKNVFNQDIFYKRYENDTLCDSYKFSLEVDKGKINHFHSGLLNAKGNRSYQFYFQAKCEKDLPKNILVNVNNIKYDLNQPDKFGNNLIERFTIINTPKLDVNEILQIPNKKIPENFSEEEIKDFKYLIFINDNHEKDYQLFKKTKYPNNKKYFEIKNYDYQIIKKIFDENIDGINEKKDKKDILTTFIQSELHKKIHEIFDIFGQGFKGYKFKNKRYDYENIKYLSFLVICIACINQKNNDNIKDYFDNFKDILSSIINFEYIDRIKILLFFVSNFLHNIKDNNVIIEKIDLFDLDNKEICTKYPYVETAYNTLYQIIDNLEEESSLYQGIVKLNSIIYQEIISNKNFHSGSLLNINDIKLELIKNINRFLVLSYQKDIYLDDYAIFDLESKTTVIYLLSIFNNEKDVKNEIYFKKAASCVLILLLHENCGHEKKNINNEIVLTPRDHKDNNFKGFSLKQGDSGDVIEYLFINDSFNIEHLMMHDDSEKLLNFSLYTGNNFDELRKIIDKIEKYFIEIKKKEDEEEKELMEEKKKVEKVEDEKKVEKVGDKKKEEKLEDKKKEEKEKEEKEEEEEEEEEEKEEESEEEKYVYNIKIKNIEIQDEENEKNKIIEQEQIANFEEINDIFEKKYGINISQKKKKLEKNKNNKELQPIKKKRLLFREMKRIYGKMTEEEKKGLKNDENYIRYLELLKNTRVKY